MKADKTAQGIDASSIPREFRENYRFLSELINCEEKNSAATKRLYELAKGRFHPAAAALNRRQVKILKCCMLSVQEEDAEELAPPVPAELEASLRIRKRSTWLPWEAEAIRKIETWRGDVLCITELANGTRSVPCESVTRKKRAKRPD
jgi:hypothetical protein